MSLDYESLPREFERRFVPREVDSGDWKQLEGFFTILLERRIGSVTDLRAWLDDYSELFAAVSEAAAIRYIRMTESTDSKEYHDAYLAFVENVEPKVKLAQFNLNRKFVESSYRTLLPREEFHLMERKIETSIKIFRESNIELEKEDRRLAQQELGVTGSMLVSYEGRERTLPEMNKYLELPVRAKREEAWKLTERRILRDRDQLDEIFDKMVVVRDRIARNSEFRDYRDYSFVSRERFDYTPADCFEFHDAVEKHIVPLVREVYRGRQNEMGLDWLRPWDMVVDPRGRAPLRPFERTPDLIGRCGRIFEKVDTAFAEDFRTMTNLNLLDLESRPGKASGGYNNELLDVRLPFIFTNSVGRDQDVWTLLHESGHAFHVFEMRNQSLHYLYRSDNMPAEFAEVASMSMELLGAEHLAGTFYDDADATRSRYDHFLSIASLLTWISTIDAFQQWVYTNPAHTREERRDAWVKTYERFGPGVSWEGLEEEKRSYWHRQNHIFQTPFYYIEYGIAQLGALGVWSSYLRNPSEAVAAYKAALALGGSRPLPELFKTAGLPWDFGAGVVESYGRELRKILLP